MTDPPLPPFLPPSHAPVPPHPSLPASRQASRQASETAGARAPATREPQRPDPPSVRLVLGTLQGGRRLTGAELREASGLPRRTVYEALRVLRERGVVQMRKSLQDTRQSYFWLAETAAHGDAGRVALRFDGNGPGQPAVSSP